jgi:hypothetical protein
MKQEFLHSYPPSWGRLIKNLSLAKFESSVLTIDPGDIFSKRAIFRDELLWTDSAFYQVLNTLSHHNLNRILIVITDPKPEYYDNEYGVYPVVFGADFYSSDQYVELISYQIGKTIADSIIFNWSACSVFDSGGLFAMKFSRLDESGHIFYDDAVVEKKLQLDCMSAYLDGNS